MNWYYEILGKHTHVGVFMNGARCGDLCFRNEEFIAIKAALETQKVILFLKDPRPLIRFFITP